MCILPSFSRAKAAMALLAAFLFSGCLTIEEHYTFKKNGSGTMEYVVDLSAFAELMGGLSDEMGKGNDKNEGPQADVEALRTVPGIKGIKVKNDEKKMIQRLSFTFADLKALNAALNVLKPDSTGATTEFFRWEGNTLVRINNRTAEELGRDLAGATDSSDTGMAQAESILRSMVYKYSFRFPQAIEDTDTHAGLTRTEHSTKQVAYSTDWAEIMRNPEVLDLRIRLKK